jgi:sugar phosphate isomerase/epimerase
MPSTSGKIPLSVQLYTLRDQTAQDFAGTMRQLAQIGYAGVELAGYGNLKTAAEAKKAVDDAGLKISGAHVGIEALEANVDKAIEDQAVLGNKFVIIPWMPEERRKDASGWRSVAKSLGKVGEACKKRGMELCYHNHSFEFQKFKTGGGAEKYGLDIFYEESDPQLVKAELDTYWIKHGGVDPAVYIKRLGNRVRLLHLKDMASGSEQRFAPVGTGIMDFKSILAAGQSAGVAWNVVEQDKCYDTSPIDAVRTSFENLKKLEAV